MKNKTRFSLLLVMILVFALALTACGAAGGQKTEEKSSEVKTEAKAEEKSEAASEEKTEAKAEETSEAAEESSVDASSEATSKDEGEEAKTVEITDAHGTQQVPFMPKKVVALDNRTFETLSDWGIELAAVPKNVMPADSPYVKDEKVENIGNHREPNLELIAAIQPDLVIVGQRFAGFYDDIKALVPNAAVIDLNIDVSTEAKNPGQNLIEGFKTSTESLAKIFGKEAEAAELLKSFDEAIAAVKAAYDPEQTVMSILVSGGDIGFSAPGTGRVWGPMYEIFNWTPALKVDNSSSDHKGDEISVEAIAQSDPDWIFVLDRDAATSSSSEESYVPASDVIANAPALKNVRAIKEEQLVYAPADTYTNESIQTYLELFKDIAEALSK